MWPIRVPLPPPPPPPPPWLLVGFKKFFEILGGGIGGDCPFVFIMLLLLLVLFIVFADFNCTVFFVANNTTSSVVRLHRRCNIVSVAVVGICAIEQTRTALTSLLPFR